MICVSRVKCAQTNVSRVVHKIKAVTMFGMEKHSQTATKYQFLLPLQLDYGAMCLKPVSGKLVPKERQDLHQSILTHWMKSCCISFGVIVIKYDLQRLGNNIFFCRMKLKEKQLLKKTLPIG